MAGKVLPYLTNLQIFNYFKPSVLSVSDYLYTFISIYAYLRLQLTSASNKKSDSGVEESAQRLFIAIGKQEYMKIEELVKTGSNNGWLNVKDKEGNTFIHLVAKVIKERRNYNIPDIDDSAPLIADVVFYIIFICVQ